MNYTTQDGERAGNLLNKIRVLLEQTGALRECKRHDGQFIDLEDEQAIQDARDVAFEEIREGKMQNSFEEMSIAMNQVLDEASFACPLCRAAESA